MSFFTKLLVFVTVPLYVLDQITKFWTVRNFPEPLPDHSSWRVIWIIEDVFRWVRVHNQGVAFGFGNGSAWAPIVFLFVPIMAMIMIRIFWKKGIFAHPAAKVAVALLLCGILGNLTDRLVQGFLLERVQDAPFWTRLSSGYVVDFISVKLPFYEKIVPSSEGWWPSFNVADSCIFIAAFTLFISGLFEEKKKAA